MTNERIHALLIVLALLLACSCGIAAGERNSPLQDSATRDQLLAQLDALYATPSALKSELRGMLKRGPERYPSRVPQGPKAQVTDLALAQNVDGSITLSWTYANPGDYDQNSQVNISDLSALGANLGRRESLPGWDAALPADGDGNGEVNISDVTTLGAGLLATLEGYIVEATLVAADPPEWSEVGRIEFGDSEVPVGGGRRMFTLQLTGVLIDSHLRVSPYEDTQIGPPSNEVLHDAAIVKGLTATQGSVNNAVELTWDAFAGAQEYFVARGSTPDALVTIGSPVDTTYLDNTAVPGTHYWYAVAANHIAHGGLLSRWSDPAEGWGAEPGPPQIDGVSPLSGPEGAPIAFTVQLSGGAPDSYNWSFGSAANPSVSFAVSPVVTLGTQGIYDCSLMVSNSFGDDTFQFQLTVEQPVDACDTLLAVPVVSDGSAPLQVIYADPWVRRDPRLNIDLLNGVVTPQAQEGYDDVLRSSGCEFTVAVEGSEVYPRLTVVLGSDPSAIDETTSGLPGAIITQRESHRLVVDVSALADSDYAFAAFYADGSPAGRGTFSIAASAPAPAALVGLGWGVNAFNRVAAPLNGAVMSHDPLSQASVATATPDVMWFEFRGGFMADPGLATSVRAVIHEDSGGLPDMEWPLELRAAGLFGETERYLGLHVVAEDDFFDAGDPQSGNLIQGSTYTVMLDDPQVAGVEDTFPSGQLLVSGT